MPLLLGLIAVGAVVLLLKWYADADAKQLKSSLRWTGVLIGLLLILGLVVTGRIGPALGMLVAFTAWIWRVFQIWQMFRQMGGALGGSVFGRARAATQDSQVSSAFLRMRLDHATGALDGEVIHGQFRARQLATLSHNELYALLNEVSGDPDSRGLLEAYLDRRWPDWRQSADPKSAAVPAPGVMDEAEALRILGLAKGASAAEIKASHRRLMGQLHPDRGGSDYLAAKVNAAKDLLLKSTA